MKILVHRVVFERNCNNTTHNTQMRILKECEKSQNLKINYDKSLCLDSSGNIWRSKLSR